MAGCSALWCRVRQRHSVLRVRVRQSPAACRLHRDGLLSSSAAAGALPLNEAGDAAPHYLENARAWMTPVLFQDWVEALDTRMRDADRRVLLLVSRSAPTHICVGLALSHVRLELLPPSVERPAGPLEGGVLAALKRRYRRYHMCHALDLHEAGRAHVFAVEQTQAMRWTRYCWRDLPDEVVRYYWQRSGLLAEGSAGGSASSVEAAEEEILACFHVLLSELSELDHL